MPQSLFNNSELYCLPFDLFFKYNAMNMCTSTVTTRANPNVLPLSKKDSILRVLCISYVKCIVLIVYMSSTVRIIVFLPPIVATCVNDLVLDSLDSLHILIVVVVLMVVVAVVVLTSCVHDDVLSMQEIHHILIIKEFHSHK